MTDIVEPTDRWTARQVAELTGLPLRRVHALVQRGVLQAERGPRGEYRFDFAQLRLVRALSELRDRLPPRRLDRALAQLREQQGGRALMRLRVELGRLVVRDDVGAFEPESGQCMLPLGSHASPVEASPVGRIADAESVFADALACEDTDAERALALYAEALALDSGHPDSCINLGRLLHERGDVEQAAALYERALERRADDPVALFNLAVAREDLEDRPAALRLYELIVRLDPTCADAFYNAARLCELQGDELGALRHLRAYRQLQ